MIEIVVVIYKIKINDCKTLQLLQKYLNKSQYTNDVKILIYDNSPISSDFVNNTMLDINIIRDNRNLGIATAYNKALQIAKKNKIKWLLLFDQDTEITRESLLKQIEISSKVDDDTVAIVPTIVGQKNKEISPMLVKGFFKQKPLKQKNVALNNLTAINSSTMIKVSFLEKIDGFNDNYSLDMLDHWIFMKIKESNKKVFVLAEKIKHNLSVLNYNEEMNIERYRNILISEYKFIKEFYGVKGLRKLKTRLLLRKLKHLLLTKDKEYYKATKAFISKAYVK